ncbi:MAG: ribosome assembly cofactor RimP [Bacteroidota bacterium]
MISAQDITKKVREHLDDNNGFLVDLKISPSNEIQIAFDKFEGAVSIQDCVALSRAIEGSLDREAEDFKLNVSSPGLSEAFKVREQYIKNKGRKVDVDLIEGQKASGLLQEVEENGIVLFCREKKKIDGKRKWIEESKSINFENIKETKVVVQFK